MGERISLQIENDPDCDICDKDVGVVRFDDDDSWMDICESCLKEGLELINEQRRKANNGQAG